jgi:hypothetical protein
MRIDIPNYLIDAINKYVGTDWEDGRDPSKIGALNAVAYIGERLVAEVSAARRAPPTEAETNLEAARKAHRHAAHVYAGTKKGSGSKLAAEKLERAAIAVTMALAIARTENG